MESSSEEDSWSTLESSCLENTGSECSTCTSSDDEDCSYKKESQAEPLGDRTNTLAEVKKPLFLREKTFALKEKSENDLEDYASSEDEDEMFNPEYQSSSSCSSGSEEEECEPEEWTATDTRKVFPFTSTPVINTGTANSPLDFFYLLFNQDFLQTLVDQINTRGMDFAQKRNKVHTPTDVEEVYTLLCTHFMMGYSGCIAEDIVWGHRPSLNIDFNTYIRKDRYILLFNLLAYKKLTKESLEDYRCWYQVAKPIVDKFNSTMKALMTPGKNLQLEKETVLYFNEQNEYRRRPDRIRMHMLADDNGIFQRVFLVDPIEQEEVRGEKIAKALMEDFFDTGRALFTNTYYTSVTLAEDFLERNTYLTGILKKNRLRNPDFLKYKPERCKLPVRTIQKDNSDENKPLPAGKKQKVTKSTTIVHGFNKQGVCVCKIVRPNIKFNMLSTEFCAKPAVDKKWECEIIEQSYLHTNTTKRDKQLSKCGPNLSFRNNRHVAYLLQAMLVNAYLMFKTQTGKRLKFVNFLEVILYQMLPLETNYKDKENATGQKKPQRCNRRSQDGPDECVLV